MDALPADARITNGLKRQFERRREILAGSAVPLGWKVGFGAPAAMAQLGIAAPLTGYMTDQSRLGSGTAISLADWVKPAAEPEIAVFIGRDLASGADTDAVVSAIAGLAPAIELVDVVRPPEDIEEILADNIYHRYVVLGACDRRRAGARLDGLVGRVRCNGGEIARVDDLEANTGTLVGLVRHVADTLARAGEMLRAGEVVIAGSVTPPRFLEAKDREFAFEAEGLGAVSIRFGER
jgi:2-keto-4-pentenoate hydratase